MVRRDPNAVDLSQQKLCLAEDVLVWPVRQAGETAYRLEIPSLHRFYRVGEEEYTFISLLDGNTTAPQACGLTAAKLGQRAPSGHQAVAIQRWLLKNELAYIAGDQPPIRDPKRHALGEKRKSIFSKVNPFWIKIPLSRDGRFLQIVSDALKVCFAPLAVMIGFFVIAIGIGVLLVNFSRFTQGTTEVFAANNWIWLLLFWIGLKIVHELGHAACCHRHGGKVSELGGVFILFAPMAYVDVTSCWRMQSRWKRIAVASAGMYVELIIASIAILFWVRAESPHTELLLHNLIFTAGVSTLLFNMNALMRFDGYFILSDLVEIPNLYGESSGQLKNIGKRFLFGLESQPGHYSGWRRTFITAYGIAALAWRVVICVTLGIAASTMFSGAGIALSIAGIGLWFGGPLVNLAKFMKRSWKSEPLKVVRGSVCSFALILVATGVFFGLPIPTAVGVPAVVSFKPEQIVRSRAAGFVRAVFVMQSQVVEQGDLLMVLDNPELSVRLQSLEIGLQQNALRQRQALDLQDASASVVLREQEKTLREQIAQLSQQTRALEVRSPVNGFVIERNLDQLVGGYINEGDVLLTIAEPIDKDITALVDHRSIHEAQESAQSTIVIRQADFSSFRGTVQQIEPRATNRLPFDSLSATQGGPLAVRNVAGPDQEDSELRLIQPHFPVRIEVDDNTAQQLAPGMRVTAYFGYRTDPLATRVATTIRQMWYQAHKK